MFLTLVIGSWGLISGRQKLSGEMIRFHVVAHSDSPEDQQLRQKVKDAVLAQIQKDLETVADITAAKEYLAENIPKIQSIVNQTLLEHGCTDHSVVTFCKETFDTRHYDTFTLPAGVYDTLNILIQPSDKMENIF